MLSLPEGQIGEAWKPSKKQCFCRNQVALDRKLLSVQLFRDHGMNQVVCCWPVTMAAQVKACLNSDIGTGTGFSLMNYFFPVIMILPVSPH
jgi:hypothetical protein